MPINKSRLFSLAEMFKKASMANSVDPDQTAPIGAVCSGSSLFASILKLVCNVRQLFAADNCGRRHFQMHFFLGAQNGLKCILRDIDFKKKFSRQHFSSFVTALIM